MPPQVLGNALRCQFLKSFAAEARRLPVACGMVLAGRIRLPHPQNTLFFRKKYSFYPIVKEIGMVIVPRIEQLMGKGVKNGDKVQPHQERTHSYSFIIKEGVIMAGVEGIFLCIGCAKGLTAKFDKYMDLVDKGMDREKALDEVGMLKLCCRNSSLLKEKHGDKPKRDIPEEERQMENPFWCVGCQKNVGHLFNTYRDRVKAGEDREAVLKDLGVTADCCIDTVKLAEQARA